MNRLLYLFKRLALGVPVMLFGLTIAFMVMYLGPIDPVLTILGRDAEPMAAEQLRIQLGLIYPDGTPVPLWDQYRKVLQDLITFNFGQSWTIQRGTGVGELLIGRMPATVWMGFWSVVIALLFGIPIGLFAGLRANTWSDYFASGFGIIWRAMPNFWLAVMIAGILSAGGALQGYRNWWIQTDVIGTPA
ncbi:ABC transporter permease, partial [Halodesulfurarchaeum sp.]